MPSIRNTPRLLSLLSRTRGGRVLLLTILALSLTASGSASTSAAQSMREGVVSGQLSKPGYTVIALGYNGRATSSRGRTFRLASPDARGLTLQLRNGKGKYAGPVIVAGQGRKLIEGVKPGASLGRIIVKRGYAQLAHPLAGRFLDKQRWVQGRGGVPLGNGRNFGLVHSKLHNGPGGSGGDTSRSGVPNAFSVDVNGDGRIDSLERGHILGAVGRLSSGSSSATTLATLDAPSSPAFSFFSQIFLDLDQTVNADAAGVTRAQIDAMLKQNLNMVGLNVPQADQVSLDCGGLSYCSAGGSGELVTGPGPNQPISPFPSCCDPSGDGFGNLRGVDAIGLGVDGSQNWGPFYPRAGSSQIGSGDTFMLRSTTGAVVSQSPVTLAFVFNSVPALASYSDGAGGSGSISYPVSAGGLGTQANPIPVAANGSGDVVLTLHFWRPQRSGIAGAGEPAFMDIGQLGYTIDAVSLAQNAALQRGGQLPAAGSGSSASVCSAESLASSDPNLTLQGSGAQFGQFIDAATDRPSDPTNLLSFSIDLSRCLADAGVASLPVGTAGAVGLKADAPNSGDHAVQNIWVRRVA